MKNLERIWLPTKLLMFGLMVLGISGCKEAATQSKINETEEEEVLIVPDPISMLVIGEPNLGPVIQRQWKARRDGEVAISHQTLETFVTSNFEIEEGVDVVIYPPELLGQLAHAEKIKPIPSSLWNSDEFNKNELLKHFRTSIVRYMSEPWAVPLGGPNFAMFCNQQAFESANVEPPDTWEEVERRLRKISTEDTPAKIDMPLAEGWAARSFLARVAPTIRQRGKLSTLFQRRTMEPLIEGKSFSEALEQLKTVATERSIDLTPKSVFDLVVKGDSVVGFTWPTRTDVEAAENDEEPAGEELAEQELIILPLPGVNKWFDDDRKAWTTKADEEEVHVDLIGFGGFVASVSAESQNETTSFEFLQWVASKQISVIALSQSTETGPFRASHLGDVSRWTGTALTIDQTDAYADVISANHRRPLVLMFPRIPAQQQYYKILDQAVREFFVSDQSAEDTLKEVADEWRKITESIGAVRQSRAIRKESGF
jgi:ABC-type glycerol-3-phosphate transport system substrate-binding protein